MEEDEIEAQARKFPRVGNGRNESNNKIGGSSRGSEHQFPDHEEEDQLRRRNNGCGGSDGSTNHFQSSGWHHHSSRIIRVSRASGGKDRHSKVMTSKGLRDRRVRLSVTTAIQFYDLQDRLGYDQPSKAVEWLIKAASDAISELPSLNNTFPETPKQQLLQGLVDEGEADHNGDGTNYQQNQSQNLSLSKSACSSTSETSKGSGSLSLSRSEIRVNREKARERARERAAKEKEKENDSSINAHHHHHHNNNNVNHHNHMSQTASFTELLTGGIGSTVTVPTTTTTSPNGSVHDQIQGGGGDEFNKARHQWSSSTVTPMDYFTSGLLQSSSRTTHQFSGENHSEQLQQHFSFMPEHFIPPHMVNSSTSSNSSQQQPSGSSDYNLNFTISSGLAAGYNRGTLQSNISPSLLPHMQRFNSPLDGSPVVPSNHLPFFIGAAPPVPTMDNNNNHHHHHLQFSPVFDARLQLFYGDGTRHSDQKEKGKN